MRVLFFFIFIFFSVTAQSRYFRWQSIEVEAFFNKKGELEVTETLDAYYDGRFNGAERYVNLRGPQKMKVKSLELFESDSATWKVYKFGELSSVGSIQKLKDGHYRWRSFPNDTYSKNVKHKYRLKYTLKNIILTDGKEYFIDHDFSFNEVDYKIGKFSLDFKIDDIFKVSLENQGFKSFSNLPPRSSVRTTIMLDKDIIKENNLAPRIGNARSKMVPVYKLSLSYLYFAGFISILMCLLCIIWFYRDFVKYEEGKGRFDSDSDTKIDLEWIKNNIQKYPPELVAAVWDQEVNETELIVILSRMMQEKKLEVTQLENPGWLAPGVFNFRPLVDVKSLKGPDRIIGDYFLVLGNHEVTTKEIKDYYTAKREFKSPITSVIESELKNMSEPIKELQQDNVSVKRIYRTFFFSSLFVFSMALSFALAKTYPSIFMNKLFIILTLVLVIYSTYARKKISLKKDSFKIFLYFPIVYFIVMNIYLLHSYNETNNITFFPTVILLLLSIFSALFNHAKSRGSSVRIAVRKKFEVARIFFQQQLILENPQLDDSLTPYILALGLEKDLDRWTKLFKALKDSQSHYRDLSSRNTGGYVSTASSWTGGGGLFSGGGSTGSWSSLATASQSSANVPSSSSGGGSGGSGGGGGGGW